MVFLGFPMIYSPDTWDYFWVPATPADNHNPVMAGPAIPKTAKARGGLVGGFKHSEKYSSTGMIIQIIPNIWKNKNVPTHQPEVYGKKP